MYKFKFFHVSMSCRQNKIQMCVLYFSIPPFPFHDAFNSTLSKKSLFPKTLSDYDLFLCFLYSCLWLAYFLLILLRVSSCFHCSGLRNQITPFLHWTDIPSFLLPQTVANILLRSLTDVKHCKQYLHVFHFPLSLFCWYTEISHLISYFFSIFYLWLTFLKLPQ